MPLLIQRSHVELPEAPDGVSVIGCDGMNDTYFLLYTDERDVQRGLRDEPPRRRVEARRDGDPFSQRFTGSFSEDGKTITGRWEMAEDGKTWRTDFDLTYTKVE